MGAASLWLCRPPTSWGGTSCQLVPNHLPSGFPPLPLCGDIPAHGAVFPALVCTIGMLINPEPEAIRLQRLYKMCLVVACFFFLISANCIFREKGPEPQREIKKKKKKNTQEKRLWLSGCGEMGSFLPRAAGPALEANLDSLGGPRVWGFGDPSPFPGWKGEGRMEVSSLCTLSQSPPPASCGPSG